MSDYEDEKLEKYRVWLVEADHQASLNYDKAILTLSGGALALSLTFLDYLVPTPIANSKVWLLLSWGLFSLSLTSILISYLFSMESLRKTIKQIDQKRIYIDSPGGWQKNVTECLRYLASISFLLAVVSFLWFTHLNY